MLIQAYLFFVSDRLVLQSGFKLVNPCRRFLKAQIFYLPITMAIV